MSADTDFLGRVLTRIFLADPSLGKELAEKVQATQGAIQAGHLLNALKDAGVNIHQPPKAPMTEERRAQLSASLTKARAAKRTKAGA